ncbi:hypothetical protein CSKR_103440 [Clonorchis sinensis]|uniref:G-protein coupled receptors family 1 profile domain-containing protein n=1 Tax=Clonorchis sinensis TaxID=79923 RepID=A0A3R7C2P9_CLOSI|nr:hypothetical protein CSKR_103440 [Clonorchis sinensis]
MYEEMSGEGIKPFIRHFLVVYCFSLIILGVIGNVLLLSTLIYKQIRPRNLRSLSTKKTSAVSVGPAKRNWKGRFRFFTTADYLLFILVSCECICIWIVLLRYGIHLASGFDFATLSELGCKIHMFASRLVLNMTVAMMSIFSAHRMISMRWPLVTLERITRTRLNWLIICSFVLIISKQIPVFFLFRLDLENRDIHRCTASLEHEDATLRQIYFYLEFSTHSGLGYFLLIAFNVTLYVTIKRYRRQNNRSRTDFIVDGRAPSCSKRENNARSQGLTMTRIIMSLSLIQVVSTTPYFLLVEANKRLKLNFFPAEYEVLVFYTCILAVYTNNALNYYIILCISRKFRQLTMELIRLVFCCVHPLDVRPNSGRTLEGVLRHRRDQSFSLVSSDINSRKATSRRSSGRMVEDHLWLVLTIAWRPSSPTTISIIGGVFGFKIRSSFDRRRAVLKKALES